MAEPIFYGAGTTEACLHASEILKDAGLQFSHQPDPQVTDLILDVPSFKEAGILRSGENFGELTEHLPGLLRIYGGNLSSLPSHFTAVDLLEDPRYLAENAAITADCALRLCGLSLKSTWKDSRILVIGWGRIGKQLCRMLKALGAQVSVCARKAPDRALLAAFGYQALEPQDLQAEKYDVIFNTAPNLNLEPEFWETCPVPMDLASKNGLLGKNVIHARGLPGIYAPLSSGRLIASCILKHLGR